MQNSIIPKLLDVVRIERVEKGLRLVYGEKHSDINQAGAEIIELMNGKRTIDEIATVISQNHESSQWQNVKQKVQRFVYDLWRQGLYMEHNNDVYLVYDYCRMGDFAVVPPYCEIDELQICYLSPCYSIDAIRTIKDALRHLGGACLRIVHFDLNGDIDQCVILLKTSCKYTFALHSIYGTLDSQYLMDMKKCILESISTNEKPKTADEAIDILKYYKGTKHLPEKDEKVVYVLSNEFSDSDLVVTKTTL